MKTITRMSRINILVTFLFIIFSLLIIPTVSFAAEDTKALLNKDIAALRGEIKGAQAKLDKAKPGASLEKITIPVSIKNMQKLLGSLSNNAGGIQSLSTKAKGLSNSLNLLEVAKNKNDMQGARRILREMSGDLTVFEKDVHALPSREGTPSTPTARKPVTQPGPPKKGPTPPGKGPRPGVGYPEDEEEIQQTSVPPPPPPRNK